MEAMRINKFLSKCGYCSRREADRLLELGKIRVNGHIPVLGQMISGQDEVTVDGVKSPSGGKGNPDCISQA